MDAMALLLSENLSVSTAIKAVHAVDIIVWGQKRHLPLRLDKNYTNVFKVLKKVNIREVTADFAMIQNDQGANGEKNYQLQFWIRMFKIC